jgi:multidrug efflux system membrane fusion protein
VVLCVFVAGALGGWYLWNGHQSANAAAAQPTQRPTPVVAVPAVKTDFNVYLQALGNVAPYNTVTIRSRVDGQLLEVHFTEGQTVHAGDPLFRIDPRAFEVQLTQAQGQLARDEASLKNAQLDLQRYLAAREAISQQQIDTAAAAVAQFEGAIKTDQGAIQSAQLQLSYCTINAPITGRIGLRLVDQGNMVHANDAAGLAVITQIQPIAVLFSLRQDELPSILAKLNAGDHPPVDVYDRSFDTKLATGKLETVDNEIDPTTGTARFKAAFANDTFALFPSQFVNVKMLIDTRRNAIAIPAAAVQRGPDGTFVYVVKEDHTVEMRPVTTGITQKETTLIAKGVNEGDVVVTDGVDKLHDGSQVVVRKPGESDTSASGPAATGPEGAASRPARGNRGGRRGAAPAPGAPRGDTAASPAGGTARGSQ